MMWTWLGLFKFFNRIGNYFYYLHVKEVTKKKNTITKSNNLYCKKCVLKYATHEGMIRKEIKRKITRPHDKKVFNVTEFSYECGRCKKKTKKEYE
jgi:hypothetical protein